MTITIEQPQLGELLCFVFLCLCLLPVWLAGVMAVDDARSFDRFLMMNGHGADVVPERKVPAGGDPAELVLDAGFVVPDANAFGNTFR